MNTGDSEKEINLNTQYIERTSGFTNAEDIITGMSMGNRFEIPAKKMFVLQLSK